MPERVGNATDIEKALVEWDAMCKVYTEAGGCALSDHRKASVLMSMLPASLNENVLKEFNKFDEQPEALRRWIRDRVQWQTWSDARVANITSWRATRWRRPPTTLTPRSAPSSQPW